MIPFLKPQNLLFQGRAPLLKKSHLSLQGSSPLLLQGSSPLVLQGSSPLVLQGSHLTLSCPPIIPIRLLLTLTGSVTLLSPLRLPFQLLCPLSLTHFGDLHGTALLQNVSTRILAIKATSKPPCFVPYFLPPGESHQSPTRCSMPRHEDMTPSSISKNRRTLEFSKAP